MIHSKIDLLKVRTKKEAKQIIEIYKKMAIESQQLFQKSFGFKKVDKWHLELLLGRNLLEVSIKELVDSVSYSIRFFHEEENDLIYQGESLQTAYYATKYFLKKWRDQQ